MSGTQNRKCMVRSGIVIAWIGFGRGAKVDFGISFDDKIVVLESITIIYNADTENICEVGWFVSSLAADGTGFF